MGDPLKFSNQAEYYVFNGMLALLILTELIIMFFTLQGGKNKATKHTDRGSIIFVLLAFYGSIFLAFFFRSRFFSDTVAKWLFPHFFYYAGITLMASGIVIRTMAVWKLRHSFTLSVQTAEGQHLIKDGLYGMVRNPAYSGSIISLIGVAFAWRNILSLVCVIVLCLIGYGIRIKIEESALALHFKGEFQDYCAHTRFKLFPGIY